MACGCNNGKPDQAALSKRPDEPCVYCAHKHVAAARALYELELGYRDINKSDAIGQLILAAWHLDKTHHPLALYCRDIWLKIEKQHDAAPEFRQLQETLWQLILDDRDTQKTSLEKKQ